MEQTQTVELRLRFDSCKKLILQELNLHDTLRIVYPKTGAGRPDHWEVTTFPSNILSKQEEDKIIPPHHKHMTGYPVIPFQPFLVIGHGSGDITYQYNTGSDGIIQHIGTIRVTVKKSAPPAPLLRGQLVPPFENFHIKLITLGTVQPQ